MKEDLAFEFINERSGFYVPTKPHVAEALLVLLTECKEDLVDEAAHRADQKTTDRIAELLIGLREIAEDGKAGTLDVDEGVMEIVCKAFDDYLEQDDCSDLEEELTEETFALLKDRLSLDTDPERRAEALRALRLMIVVGPNRLLVDDVSSWIERGENSLRNLKTARLSPRHALRYAERGVTNRRADPKIGRNDPCPCGRSGRKYKRCCLERRTG
jgi:hypothetical protein